ncbi:Uncharacterised protein [Legionella longbeachae]|nr:Uncharacterised protein [Legionella longbeachae]
MAQKWSINVATLNVFFSQKIFNNQLIRGSNGYQSKS